MKLPVNRNSSVLALAMVLALGAGLGGTSAIAAGERKAPMPDVMGPEGDYPVTIGDPFTVDGVTYTPADTLNYDAVGKALAMGADETGPARISGAHRTLPVPSYVEVTALDSGRTIVVRIDRRGPMSGNGLLALSPMAWAQLGLAASGSAPVRVRRVNPPEPERALLRTGQAAPQRMDTPPGLLAALRRKLGLEPPVGDLPVTIRPADVVPGSAAKPVTAPPAVKPVLTPEPKPATKPPAKPAPAPVAAVQPEPRPKPTPAPAPTLAPTLAPTQATRPASARFFVQIGAFAQRGNAEAAARKAGGSIVQSGTLWRVRSGPFSAGDEAERGLAKARAAGYAGARIVRD
ncbi:SPOR domain-containing protein [Novosphingobium sp. PASSN1]|uniref:septal ring lytic transglycosylase RlpA family protein n=1 Tax=Novosphingobium sp. PASSN1 TaxID=2015561 RepID=UPI000BDBCA66|nr:SPOR domain-containing protein [Novosphingobium sp. PASSN1]OYU37279.1 MAG: sporulation protein SsgA [Novosphingobium sp. PASSN1]